MTRNRLPMAKAAFRAVRVPESSEQAHGVALLRTIGGRVWVTGTRRRKTDFQGTMMTPGLPDVFAFLPRRSEPPRKVFLVWECKAADGRLRPEQIDFRDCCRDADVHHVAGPLDALIAWLVAERYVKADAFPHYRQPGGQS